MPNDKATAPKVETPVANDSAKSGSDMLNQLAHNLTWQCRDGSLVPKPTDCGDYSFNNTDMSKILPQVSIG